VQGIDVARVRKFDDLADNEIGHRIKLVAVEIERLADHVERCAHGLDIPGIYCIVSKRHGFNGFAAAAAAS
jgi:hypothetical protein